MQIAQQTQQMQSEQQIQQAQSEQQTHVSSSPARELAAAATQRQAGTVLAELSSTREGQVSPSMQCMVIIIIPCKPYLSASATAPHPLGRRKVERLFSLFSV
jgi:hypothetical protein